ncbi:MAG: Flp pilus assembly complex ATPase component TadA, partial [Flavobacteriales bacterium]|nr:Flp pilus assembly complex ATPase component TadA [Flavobacteriales bacterium]
SLHLPLISRLKVLASLNITEKRLPQDGRISLEYVSKPYDLRMATVATKNGEKVTMRILDSSKLELNLGHLIVAEKVSSVIRKLFYRPNGPIQSPAPPAAGRPPRCTRGSRSGSTKKSPFAPWRIPLSMTCPASRRCRSMRALAWDSRKCCAPSCGRTRTSC